jgi:hypothetical protein
MDLLGTFRVKLATTGFKKHAGTGKFPKRWYNIDIFSKKEKHILTTEIVEVVKHKRSHHPMTLIPEKLSKRGNVIKAHYVRDDKYGVYKTWTQTIKIKKQKWILDKDVKEVLIGKIHGTEIPIDIKNIVCWRKLDESKIPKQIVNPILKEPGITPYHKPVRTCSTKEKQLRYNYLLENGFLENTINVIERGYSAKDIKNARKKLATKDNITKKKVLASRIDAEKFLKEKLAKRKPIAN